MLNQLLFSWQLVLQCPFHLLTSPCRLRALEIDIQSWPTSNFAPAARIAVVWSFARVEGNRCARPRATYTWQKRDMHLSILPHTFRPANRAEGAAGKARTGAQYG